MLRYLAPIVPLLGASVACTDPVVKTVSIVRIRPNVDPECGSPADARTMVVRALGEFSAGESSAQSIELGVSGTFSIDRFPLETRMLEVEVRGFGGALRTVGRSLEFSIIELDDGAEIPVFMAPKEGICPTGPASSSRRGPLLARAGDAVLMAGGTDALGAPVLPLERYEPGSGSFVQLDDALYADTSPLGLQGASMTELSGGDVVIVGGAATAYQIYLTQTEELTSPAFYREARAHHAALALQDNRVFLAGGCTQLTAGGCASGSELLTSSILDPGSGQLDAGPSLQQARIGGSAWLEGTQSILLAGGVDEQGDPVTRAERVFLDGRASVLVDQVAGVAAQSPAGSVWVGLAGPGQPASAQLLALAPGLGSPSTGLSTAFADSDAILVALEDGSLLALGQAGAQRIRSFDGQASDLQLSVMQGRQGQSAIRLPDGSVLIVGGGVGDPGRDAFVYRPALVGPLSASASVSFASDDLSEGLSASDPNRVVTNTDFGAHLELSLASSPEEWLIVSGPRFQTLLMEAALATEDASALLYFGWRSPQAHWKLVLSGGTRPTLIKVEEGQERVIGGCKSSALGSLGRVGEDRTHGVSLAVREREIELLLDGESVFSCSVDEEPELGAAGVGLRGSLGQELRLDLISLGR